MVGSISGTTITYASKYVYDSQYNKHNRIAYDPNSGKFVISNLFGGAKHGAARVATLAGTAISFGSSVTWNPSTVETPQIAFSTNSKFVIAYRDNSNGNAGSAIVGTLSGTSISFSSEYVLYI